MDLLFQIKINKNWNFESGVDCGFEYGKVQGLFSKSEKRRGTGRSKPLDLRLTAQIRIGEGRRDRPAGTVPGTVGRHFRWRKLRRRSQKWP